MESSGLFGFAGFTGVRLGCCLAHPESTDSLGYALEVFVLFPVSMGSLGCSSGPSVVAGLNRVRPGVRLVYTGSLRSQGCALGAVGFIRYP